MPLDLDEIRARHEPYADTRVGQDIAAMLSEIDRLTSELAAAQAGPVAEWHPTFFGAAARIGLWRLSVGAERWALRLKIPDSLGLAELIDSGDETGPAGKAAAEAAYRRACGLPTASPNGTPLTCPLSTSPRSPEPPMLDLAAIRRRWAAPPWTDGRSPELAADITALLSEVDRLHTVAESRLMRMRTAGQTLIAEIGAKGPENVDLTAARAVAVIEDLRAEVDRLTSELAASTRPYLILDDPEGIIGCVEATSPEAAWEAFKAENPNDYSGDPADNDVVIERVTVAWCDRLVDGLEIARSELAAAQTGPVVEWRHLPGSAGWERADVGQFSLLLMGDSAWRLVCGDQAVIARGSPGGDAGKAAAVAAYRRACGFPTIPPCAG